MANNQSQFISPGLKSLWSDTCVIKTHPSMTNQVSVDVCVIGAGITGLTAADLIKKSGRSVAVIDVGRIGRGETSHTTAHVTEVFDLDYRDLLSRFGAEGAQLAAQSMRRSIERIEENVREYEIACDFQRVSGYKFTENRGDSEGLEGEAEAAAQVGVPAEILFDAPLPFRTERAIRFDHQAQFHPLKYLQGLANRIPGNGSFIFEETRMLDIEEGAPCRVLTDRGTIVADDVFVAAHVPSANRFFLHTKIAAYRTYAIAVKMKSSFLFRHLYWDVADPYHYIRSVEMNGQPYLIIGGEDHKTGQDDHTDVHFERLIDWSNERFGVEQVTHHWSGQVIESVDGLPFIGRNPMSDHVFVSTGYSGTGLTMGTLGGMLVSDLILGHQNPWADLYSAGRVKPLASMRTFIAENLDFPSHLISDRFSAAQVSSVEELRENSGAIVRIGAKKIAAYRDTEGELHLLSPVCPHLGCHVHWNESEKSWDCPCHGSRFDPVGKLLNGPAVADLTSEEYDENLPVIHEPYEQPNRSVDPLGPPVLGVFSGVFRGAFSCPLLRS